MTCLGSGYIGDDQGRVREMTRHGEETTKDVEEMTRDGEGC